MYFTYLLKNEKGNLYIGSTNNLKLRIKQHKTAKKNYKILYYEAYKSEKDARIREKKLKYFGRAYQELKKRLTNSINGAG